MSKKCTKSGHQTEGQAGGKKIPGRPSFPRADEPVLEEPDIDAIDELDNSMQQALLLNTQEELQALVGPIARPQADTRKRGRHSRSDGAGVVDERPLAAENETAKSARRSRSSKTETELQSASRIFAKEQSTKTRRKQTAHVEIHPVDFETSEVHTEQLDVEILEPSVPEPVAKDVSGRTAQGRKSGHGHTGRKRYFIARKGP